MINELRRLSKIYGLIARYRLDRWQQLPKLWRPLLYLHPSSWRRHYPPLPQAVRLVLIELGPIFIKFGQILSTRRDLLSPDLANELAQLQDQVPPFSGELARQLLETIYQQPLTQIFRTFDDVPLAAASIAQVHAATLLDGQSVVVKLLRPNILRQIQKDIAVIRLLAKLAQAIKKLRRFKLIELVAEFEAAIYSELDLRREAASASQLRRHFANSQILYIPKIYWDYAQTQAIAMERIQGIPIRDLSALMQAGIDRQVLAERLIKVFLIQVFEHCFFHADMHPGNIFVDIEFVHNPRYIFVDFGIMGTLSAQDQRYIAENFLAFFNRDYRRVAELHLVAGWAPPQTRIDQLEMAIRAVCEPMFERSLADISLGELLLQLFQMAAQFNIEIQPQLILLQKTLLQVEGLGRYLYPALNLWQTAKPFLERWLRAQIGPKAFLQKVKKNLPSWLEQLPEWPQLLYNKLQVQTKTVDLAQIQVVHRRGLWQGARWTFLIVTILFAILLMVLGKQS